MRGLPPLQTAAELSAELDVEARDAEFAKECIESRSLSDPVTDAAAPADLLASNRPPGSLRGGRGGRGGPSSTGERKALLEVCLSAFAFSLLWSGMGSRLAHLA